MAHYLQPNQINCYSVKRMAINRVNGSTSILLGTNIPWLSAIVCKIFVSPGPYGRAVFTYAFSPLSSDLHIPQATEDLLKVAVYRIFGQWLDTLGICTETGVLL